MIIFRYLSKEIVTALITITVILLLIFLSNQLVRYLGYVTDGRLAVTSLFKLMLLEVPNLLGLLLPLALYLASMFVYSRMTVEREMTVLAACGINRWQLFLRALPISIMVMLLVALLSLWLNPLIMEQRNHLLEKSGMVATLQTLLPGQFQELSGGNRVIFISHISPNRDLMQDIFIAQRVNAKTDSTPRQVWEILSARTGYQQIDKKTGDHFIVTADTYRYLGVPGATEYELSSYGKYGVRLQAAAASLTRSEDALPTWALWLAGSKNKLQAAELQWRLSLPLMTLLLAILAVPLGQPGHNQGRYARFFPAVLLFIIYANMLFVARAWVKQGVLATHMGLWIIHGVLGLVMLLIIFGPKLQFSLYRWWQAR